MSPDETPDDGPRRIPKASDSDGDLWMARFATLRDDELDELLAGRNPAGQDDLAPMAAFNAALRAHARAQPVPPMGAALRAQISRHPEVPARHVRAAQRRLRIGALVGAAAAVVAIAASQNALPAPAQRFVSDVGDVVGLHVPRPEDDDDADDQQPADVTVPGDTSRSDGETGPPEDPGTTPTTGGPPAVTPGGATPADPGGPDGPATPATPPEQSDGGQGNGQGTGNGQGNGNENGNPGNRGGTAAGGADLPDPVGGSKKPA